MKAPEKEGKEWLSTTVPNLVRYASSGTYFLRAKINGRHVRESLGTDVFRDAKQRLADRLRELRAPAVSKEVTLPTLLQRIRVTTQSDMAAKASTRRHYGVVLDRLEKQADLPRGPIREVTDEELEKWWAGTVTRFAPQQANHNLMLVRRAYKMAVEDGDAPKNLAAKLRRAKLKRTRLDLPSKAEFAAIIASVRAQGHRLSAVAADWMEWAAYTGMRPAEIAAVEWRDVNLDAGLLYVTGGKLGTKNHETRILPIIAPLRGLIERMGGPKEGQIFSIKRPQEALRSACRRLNLPHQRIYNLRHLFATTCLESGVDVPTLASWIGHRDGGALAMRTYIQNRDEHRASMAAKVTFGT